MRMNTHDTFTRCSFPMRWTLLIGRKWSACFRDAEAATTLAAGTRSRRPLRLTYSHPALPQHQLRDLQGVEGSSLQELVATAPER
jgi:hypothetical protein